MNPEHQDTKGWVAVEIPCPVEDKRIPDCTKLVIPTFFGVSMLMFWLGIPGSTTTLGVVESVKYSVYLNVSSNNHFSVEEIEGLDHVLTQARLRSTVIVAPVNSAWAGKGGIMDNFLESFELGEGISYLRDHLVIAAMDSPAYARCTEVHRYCFQLKTEGVNFTLEEPFMTEGYLKLTQRKTELQTAVLELGFDLIFSDMDIVWFREPFKHFSSDTDMDLACDGWNGNSTSPENAPNTGFFHARSNPRTIRLFKYWQEFNAAHPGQHDQDVLNILRSSPQFAESGARVKFMPTLYFGGFCEKSSDLEKVCTMHANCCMGGDKKLADLKLTLEDWKAFKSMTPQESRERNIHFRAPKNC